MQMQEPQAQTHSTMMQMQEPQAQTHSTMMQMQEPQAQTHSTMMQMQEPQAQTQPQMMQMQEPQTHSQMMQMQEPQTHSQMLQMQGPQTQMMQMEQQPQTHSQMVQPQDLQPQLQMQVPMQDARMYTQPQDLQPMCGFVPMMQEPQQVPDQMDGPRPSPQDVPIWWSQAPQGDLPYMVVPVYGVAPLPLAPEQQHQQQPQQQQQPVFPSAMVRQYSPPRLLEPAEEKPVDRYPGALQVNLPSPSSPASAQSREKKRRGLCKVFVGGLAPGTTSQDLLAHFAKYGAKDAQVCSDNETRRSRGFGYVELAGKPPPGLLGEHILDGRRCGVREYDYPGRRRGR